MNQESQYWPSLKQIKEEVAKLEKKLDEIKDLVQKLVEELL